MKLLSLNINKFNYDFTKHSVLSYVSSINADLCILQEYTYKLSIPNTIYPSDIALNETNKNHSFIIGISSEYLRKDQTEYKFISLQPSKKDYPKVLGVHLAPNESLSDNINPELFEIICGDFNTGIKELNKYPTKSTTAYCTLINNYKYIDLWRYAINENKGFIIDCFGNEHLAFPNVFYRTFNTQRINDFIMAKDEFKNKLIKICIDYRTLAFSDHCAIIATFKE